MAEENTSLAMPPPRIFGISATQADIVAVICRGPSQWCQVGLWDTAARSYQAGSWVRGKLFPQRCDMSPDGRWFSYMAFQGHRFEKGTLGDSYIGISRLPWLTALAAWRLDSTYPRGLHFVRSKRERVEPSTQGNIKPCYSKYGLAHTLPGQFAVEKRRGWSECFDSPEREADDVWDSRRVAEIEKWNPNGDTRLVATGKFFAFREGVFDVAGDAYFLERGGELLELEDVQWADWSRNGELLIATTAGELRQIVICVEGTDESILVSDISAKKPAAEKPPKWANCW